MEKTDSNNFNIPQFSAVYSLDRSSATYNGLAQAYIVSSILPAIIGNCDLCYSQCETCSNCVDSHSHTIACQRACNSCRVCSRNCWI